VFDCDGSILDCAGVCGGSNICGCTDTTSLNYDATATFNDDSCEFDTTAPTVVITYPANNSTLDSTTVVRVDVADSGDISKVTFLVNGVAVHNDTVVPYEYEWNVCNLSREQYTLFVKAEDSEGNIGQSDLFTFTIDASYDCESVCGGGKLLDNCDVCDADTTNDCPADCNGDYGGTASLDDCNDCVGGETGLTLNYAKDDCGVCINCSAIENDCSVHYLWNSNQDCSEHYNHFQ
jgi:hypothetical protein